VLFVASAAYLVGVARLRRRGEEWPLRRTIGFFALGLLPYAAIELGFLAVFSAELRWAFSTRIALLIFAVPAGIAAGRPLDLAARLGAGAVIERVLASRVTRIFGNAMVATVVIAAVFCLFLTPLAGILRVNPVVEASLGVVVPLVGLAMVLPMMALGAVHTGTFIAIEFLLAFVELLIDSVPGLLLRLNDSVVDLIPDAVVAVDAARSASRRRHDLVHRRVRRRADPRHPARPLDAHRPRRGPGLRRPLRRGVRRDDPRAPARRTLTRVDPRPPPRQAGTVPTHDDVDAFLTRTLVGSDPILDAALSAQHAAGLPSIEVAPVNAKFLHLLTRIAGARRVLEIGTLGGYSTIWFARAVGEGGRVVSIEAESANADVARANLRRAGVADRVDVRVGRGADVLPTLEGEDAFDLVFIDADKESNTLYLDWAARLGRPGTVVGLDNVVRGGDVADADTTDSKVQGARRGILMLGSDPRFDATALQTLDRKGWDGVALAIVVDAGEAGAGS
jgi:predicted O-methyltransferase YrrM